MKHTEISSKILSTLTFTALLFNTHRKIEVPVKQDGQKQSPIPCGSRKEEYNKLVEHSCDGSPELVVTY